jgi:hypothetical protein
MWVWHPQEGFYGHFKPTEADKLIELVNCVKVVKVMKTQILSKKYTIADMITGFGCRGSFHSIYGGDVKGKKIVQGWKCRFSSTAEMGAKVSVIDRDGGLMKKDSLLKKIIVPKGW